MTWLGDHSWKVIRFGTFMFGSSSFSAEVKCENCGMVEIPIVYEEDLLRLGVTVDEIKEGRNRRF
jgi:uncharacterized Zn finger protein